MLPISLRLHRWPTTGWTVIIAWGWFLALARGEVMGDPVRTPADLTPFSTPPPALVGDFGTFRSPLVFRDGKQAATPGDWRRRRVEILLEWQSLLGPWPPLLEAPRLEILQSGVRENFNQHRVRVEIARDQWVPGWLLIPAASGRRPAALVLFYEPETSAGLNASRHRDFALQLVRRGFVALAVGSPGGDAWRPDIGSARCQPLSFLAYAAANAHTALAKHPAVDSARIGIVGHSYGGKWALFAAAFDERFACCVVSDPGVVFDETRPNVNYWEPWYLGREEGRERSPGLVSEANPRTGAYRHLVAGGHDLHEVMALLAPRPFLVSGGAEDPPERWRALNHLVGVNALLGITNRVAMTQRPHHDPDAESNAVIIGFFERFLGGTDPD